MAYQRVDPQFLAPRGFQAMEVQHRVIMTRVVARRPLPMHEDFVIVSINPLPQQPMQFGPIQDVLHEFLEDHMRMSVREIQPSHLGQAQIRLVHVHDRDNLVFNSPFNYGDVQISFAKHNEVRNWRALNFNRECYLMLLGFPLDYWDTEIIRNALPPFSHLIIWENNRSYCTRLLVKARVTDLQDVPHFIVISEGEGFQG
jgi:hypothetical protein